MLAYTLLLIVLMFLLLLLIQNLKRECASYKKLTNSQQDLIEAQESLNNSQQELLEVLSDYQADQYNSMREDPKFRNLVRQHIKKLHQWIENNPASPLIPRVKKDIGRYEATIAIERSDITQ